MYSMERSRFARTLLACSAMHQICHRMHKRWPVRPGGSVVERDRVAGRRKSWKTKQGRRLPGSKTTEPLRKLFRQPGFLRFIDRASRARLVQWTQKKLQVHPRQSAGLRAVNMQSLAVHITRAAKEGRRNNQGGDRENAKGLPHGGANGRGKERGGKSCKHSSNTGKLAGQLFGGSTSQDSAVQPSPGSAF